MTRRLLRNQGHCPVPAICDECRKVRRVRIFADPRNAFDVLVLCPPCDASFHSAISAPGVAVVA